MIAFIKHAIITFVGMAGFLAALLAIASFSAQGMSDNEGDTSGRTCGIVSVLFVGLCVVIIFSLAGCSDAARFASGCARTVNCLR